MLESIRLLLAHNFPNAEIALHEEKNILNIQIIGHDKNLSKTEIHKKISKILIDSESLAKYPAATIKIYENQEEFISTTAHELLKKAIAAVMDSTIEIEIYVAGEAIQVSLRSNGFHSIQNREIVTSKAKEALQNSTISKKYIMYISTYTYPPSFNLSPSTEHDESDDSYGELNESKNPNWPSTTGNPSGGGRGNNI